MKYFDLDFLFLGTHLDFSVKFSWSIGLTFWLFSCFLFPGIINFHVVAMFWGENFDSVHILYEKYFYSQDCASQMSKKSKKKQAHI